MTPEPRHDPAARDGAPSPADRARSGPDPVGVTRVLRGLAWGGAAALWLLPVVVSATTQALDWTAFDFMLWGVMLTGGAAVFEAVLRLGGGLWFRAGAALALGAGFALVTANLAVGVIGSEDRAVNLIFFGLVLGGLIGAFVVRFRARGLMRVTIVVAAAQALAAGLALWLDGRLAAGLTLGFALAWLGAAWLFARAARSDGRTAA